MADIVTTNIVWNGVLSTEDVKYMYIDTKNMSLETSMERFEYIKISIKFFSMEFIDAYNLHGKKSNSFVCINI